MALSFARALPRTRGLRRSRRKRPRLTVFLATSARRRDCSRRRTVSTAALRCLKHRDVKAVEHVDGTASLAGDDFEVGLPHVRAPDLETPEETFTRLFQRGEAVFEGGLGAFAPDPEQAASAGIDLVDEGDEVAAPFVPPPVKFVHTDDLHALQAAMLHSPPHHPLHVPAHGVPAGAENLRRLLPGEQFGRVGRIDHVRRSLAMLAHVPGHVFNRGFARRGAGDPTRCVVKKTRSPHSGTKG